MDRQRTPLLLLLALLACTVVSIVLDGATPASDPDVLPWAVQVAGYLAGLAAGVLLLAPGGGDGGRRTGGVVVAAVVVLALLDAATLASDGGGANIGAGFVRLVVLLVLCAVTARLSRDVAAARRPR